MRNGQYIFYQLTRSLSQYTFQQCVREYHGDRYVKSLTCWQQFLCLSFGQLTFRESLRSIVLCLNTHPKKLYHLGFSSPIKLSTLAYANERRDWRMYESFGHYLINKARQLYQDDITFLDDLKGTFYALDATTIDLCLSVFKWAHFREYKGAIKLHALLDLRGNIPVFIRITDGTVHEVNILDSLPIEAGACYVMDRGYLDYRRLYTLHAGRAFFITRAKRNTRFARVYSRVVKKSTGVRCDQIIRFRNHYAAKEYPEKLRRIKHHDNVTNNTYVFLTNNFDLTAEQIANIYKRRWDIEQFFKWIKGHLKVKVFWGESANAVKTQIWVAICTYVMVAILKKERQINQSMYEILQILSVNTFERTPLVELFSKQSSCNFIRDNEFQAKLPSF